ncbi:MAG: phosphate ABC transporter permease PstA [Exilispira sp.]|jgi:phosphate transport system permease protein|nr:phosphate ABC transporter permease PstA [Exilispira sp.]
MAAKISKDNNLILRKTKNILFNFTIIFLSLVAILPLFFILGLIVKKGIETFSINLFIFNTRPVGEPENGILNAIIGTFLMVISSSIFASIFGIIIGLFLSENKGKKIYIPVRLSAEIIQGIPSIVIGIIAYIICVKPMRHFSAFAGTVALFIMMLPYVIINTEETISRIPYTIKEAAIALGVPYYKTIIKVILPSGISGILSGILVGIARIAGETAPLLFTAFGNQFLSLSFNKPINAIPLVIFNYTMSPYPELHKIAWSSAFVLVLFVLLINITAKFGAKKWKIEY